MAVTTTQTNKPINPRGNDQSPKGYNRAQLFSGKALDFDGVNDNVDAGTLDITAYTAISVAGYINKDSTSTQVAIGIKHTGSDDIRFVVGGNIELGVDDGTYYNVSTPINNNEWYFAVLTFDGSTLKGYLNGVEFGSTSASFDFSTADGKVTIGQRDGGSLPYNGRFSNAKVFNTALTAAQVADLYNNPEKIVPTGVDDSALKLWLPMQEGAGTTAYDGSGNGNHGTISGATYTHGIGAPVSQTAVIDWNKGVNKLTNSSNLGDVTNWNRDGDTAIDSGYLAPDGTNTAYKVSTIDSTARLVQQNVTDADDYRAIWARTTSGTGDVNLLSNNGNTNNLFTITEEWQKFSVNSAPASGDVIFYAVDFRGTSVLTEVILWQPHCADSESVLVPTLSTAQTSEVLLPQGLTTGRDITGVNLFENVRKQGALNLDGNSWAEVHDNASLDVTTAVTLEAWVYWGDEGVSDGIIGKGGDYLLYVSASKYAQFYLNGSYGTNAYLLGTNTGWYHIVGTYDGTSQKIYINGSLENTQAITGSINLTNKVLDVGRYNSSSGTEYTNQIAQPRIYNRALTAEEVQRNYNAGKNIYTND